MHRLEALGLPFLCLFALRRRLITRPAPPVRVFELKIQNKIAVFLWSKFIFAQHHAMAHPTTSTETARPQSRYYCAHHKAAHTIKTNKPVRCPLGRDCQTCMEMASEAAFRGYEVGQICRRYAMRLTRNMKEQANEGSTTASVRYVNNILSI
jgi:hypothetical protein